MDATDDTIREIFRHTRVIACIGASPRPERPSHFVSLYLKARGYRVIPVNPGQAGRELFGEKAVARVSDIDLPVDMIDIFRRSDRVLPVVEEALDALPGLQTVWMQIGVQSAKATELARAQGVTVVENRCPMVEIPRLFGKHWTRSDGLTDQIG
ncbi:CoA-binding protein [Tropicimonas marinistellae]|uniref:CoA-binding protein n=1 Tax=Tropicimonas marinistellae TaxID=1739787 RepID=UPI00082CBE56|nr:CoA-binding protein [Tropicimonas marinistellae]